MRRTAVALVREMPSQASQEDNNQDDDEHDPESASYARTSIIPAAAAEQDDQQQQDQDQIHLRTPEMCAIAARAVPAMVIMPDAITPILTAICQPPA